MILLRKTFSLRATRVVAGLKRMAGKTPMQAKRGAIDLQNKALDTMAKGKIKVDKALMNPGKFTADMTGEVIKRPVTAASQVGGTALLIAHPATGAIPVGAIGAGLEEGIKRASPRYAKVTNKMGKLYEKSKLPRQIESITNSGIGTLQSIGL